MITLLQILPNVPGDSSRLRGAAQGAAEGVRDNVGGAIDTLGDVLSPSRIISAIVVLLIIWLLTKVANWLFSLAAERFNRQRLRILRVQPVVSIVLWFSGVYAVIFGVFHPNNETLLAVAGSSALALGFALQDVVKNMVGGLLIIFDRPFQIGDRIDVKGQYGEVERIRLRNTTIRTLDDSVLTVPNGAVVSEVVSNANAGALDCMVVADLWLPVDVDVERIRTIALEAATTSRFINFDRAVQILFFDHFDNKAATNVKIKAYVLDARYEKAFAGDITEAAKKAFGQEGIYSNN